MLRRIGIVLVHPCFGAATPHLTRRAAPVKLAGWHSAALQHKMGAWGFGSDENDLTYDSLGLGIMERFESDTGLSEEGKKEFWKQLANEGGPLHRMAIEGCHTAETIGTVVWLVKQGALVPIAVIEVTIAALEFELETIRSSVRSQALATDWRHWKPYASRSDVEKRAKAIEYEIALLQRAQAGGPPGFGQIEAVGTNSLLDAMTRR